MPTRCPSVGVILCLFAAVYGYKNGFTKDACETLCPLPGCPANTTGDGSDAGLKLSDRGFPLSNSFKFSEKIRRTTPFRGGIVFLMFRRYSFFQVGNYVLPVYESYLAHSFSEPAHRFCRAERVQQARARPVRLDRVRQRRRLCRYTEVFGYSYC